MVRRRQCTEVVCVGWHPKGSFPFPQRDGVCHWKRSVVLSGRGGGRGGGGNAQALTPVRTNAGDSLNEWISSSNLTVTL